MRFKTDRIVAGCDIDGNPTLTIIMPRDMPSSAFNGLYDVEIKKHREIRSLNANALFWKCCGSIADIIGASKEEVYLQMLERYGVQKFIVVKPEAAESVKPLFRAVYNLGFVYVGKKRGVQLRCIVGSSHYDTEQMARLLDGTIEECKDLGAFVPDEKDVGYSIKLWEKERE